MQHHNYQKELDALVSRLECLPKRKKLLLHSCCGPCSSYCLEYTSKYFDVTLFYYNPNITDKEEYIRRVEEQKRLIEAVNRDWNCDIKFVEAKYNPEAFIEISKGLEECPEGGERCKRCFELRLREAAEYASINGFDYFTTTLTISPLKNADVLNTIGGEIGKEKNVEFLPSDFKKKNGYKRSVELSEIYELYRQDYCGCGFSKAESIKRRREKELSE